MFFKKSAFGLDISDYSIEVISLSGSLENPRLLAMGRIILEPGIIKDGEILNEEKLTSSLKNLIKNPKFGKIKTRKFIFSIPESRTFIYILEFPKDLKKKEELEFVKSQVKQTFPYSLKDLYLDFKIFTPLDNKHLTGQDKEVLLIAAPKNIVDGYLEIFKSCQLQPLVLEVESESLARSLIKDQKETVLIVDIGARTSNFSIFDEKGLRISISNKTAGNKFTQSLAERLKISLKEAEKLKRKFGLNPEIEEGKFFLVLQKDIQLGIVWGIRKIEKYFQKKTGKKIEKIILAGGSAMLPYIQEYLAKNLEKEIVIGNPWAKINTKILKKKGHSKRLDGVKSIFYATCIGSTLRGLTKNPKKAGINLIKGRK